MTPQRRSRFFLSLRQLEHRLAAESTPKKTRLTAMEPDAPRQLPNVSSQLHHQVVLLDRGCDDFAEASSLDSGSLGNNRARMPNVETNVDAGGQEKDDGMIAAVEEMNGEAHSSRGKVVPLAQKHQKRQRKIVGSTLAGIVKTRGVQWNGSAQETTTLEDGQGGCLLECLSFGERDGKTSVPPMQLRCNSQLVQQDVDARTSAVFCESGGSADNGDGSSPLVFSANWNPWEIGRNSGWSESNPPAEFLSSPASFSNRVETLEAPCIKADSKCQNCECKFCPPKEYRGWLEDFSHLCALLHLDVGQLLAANKPDWTMQEDNGQPTFDSPALKLERLGSLLYSHIGAENCFQYAQALDHWVAQLVKSRTEPFCLAALLIAKASLRQNDDLSKTESLLTFPHVVKEWLASQPPIFKQ